MKKPDGLKARLRRLEEAHNEAAKLDLGEFLAELFRPAPAAKDPCIERLLSELAAVVPRAEDEDNDLAWLLFTAGRHPEGRRLLARVLRRMKARRTAGGS